MFFTSKESFSKAFYFVSKAILNLFSDDFEMGKFITREKGNPQLLDTLGYSYNRHKSNLSKTKVYWRCSQMRLFKCMARATTEGNFIVKHVGEHSHLVVDESQK